MEQLSGVMIIIIIGGAVLTFIMLFIFAKRQIMRFTLRSRRGPHVPIGNDAKKVLRREVESRLDCIQKIVQEPKLLWPDDYKFSRESLPYYYRILAVDDVKVLEEEIALSDGTIRYPLESLRAFLLSALCDTLEGMGQRIIHQFCDMYEHARHDSNQFGKEEYDAYHRHLVKLFEACKQLKALTSSRKISPARTPRTPRKQTKTQSLLDPSRLKRPTTPHKMGVGQHSKVNLTLGLQNYDAVDVDKVHSKYLQTPRASDVSELNPNGYEDEHASLSGVTIPFVLDNIEGLAVSSVQTHGNSSII